MISCNDALMDEAFFKEEGSGKDGGPATTNNAAKKWWDPHDTLLRLSIGPPIFDKNLNAHLQKLRRARHMQDLIAYILTRH